MMLAILKATVDDDMRCNLEFEPFHLDETEDELQQFYKAIGCDCVEYHELELGCHVYDCICDEEAHFKHRAVPTLWLGQGYILCNNIVFANCRDSKTAPLSYEDYERIAEYVRGHNVKMLNAFMRGMRKKKLEKLLGF